MSTNFHGNLAKAIIVKETHVKFLGQHTKCYIATYYLYGKRKIVETIVCINEFLIPLIHPTTIIITCLSQLGIKPNCGFDTSTQIINCQMFQTQYKYPGLIVQLAREVDHVFFCLTGKLNTFFCSDASGILFSDI